MNSTAITTIISAIAIISAAVFGFLYFRLKSKESKKSEGKSFSPIKIDRKKTDEKNEKPIVNRDISTFHRLQGFIDSNWIENFQCNQLAHPQYVQEAVTDDLHLYWNESQKPENEFLNQNLAEAHLVFILAIKAFIRAVIKETTFVRPESKASIVNSKAERHRKSSNDYDERYDREVKIITHKAEGIIKAFKRYIQVAEKESVPLHDN